MSDDIKTRLGDVIGGSPATPEVIEDAYAEIVVLQAEVDREREKIEALRAALHEALDAWGAWDRGRGADQHRERIDELRKLTEGP